MLSARTSETNRQIAFPLANVVRKQIDQQLRDTIDELFRLWKRSNVFSDSRITSRQRAKLGHKMRIGKKAHIKHQVCVVRHSVFVSKTHAGDENRLLRPRLLLKAVRQVRAQIENIKSGRINDQVG